MSVIHRNWQVLTAAKDRSPIWDWASRNIELPKVLTISGRFNPNVSRHFIPVFDALQDDAVRVVVVRKPVRGGGSLISDIWHAWTRANDPGPAMVVMQNDKVANEHAEARLMPTLINCIPVAAMLPSDRHKLCNAKIIYADGIPIYVTGPAIGQLQSKGIRYLTCDEPWLYKPGMLKEAEGRLGDFIKNQTSKFFILSQAGVEDDDFDRYWVGGHQAIRTVRCLGCNSEFIPRWSGYRPDGGRWGMMWDEHKDARGMWSIGKCLDSIRYESPCCGYVHLDGPRTKEPWNLTGGYSVTNPTADRSRRSFAWNAILDYPWRDLVSEFLGAMNAYKMGVVEPLIQFFQKRMAEPKSERSLLEGSLEVKRSAYDPNSAWPEEGFRAMTIDRQEEDVFWWLIRAWSKNGESRRIAFGKAFGFAELATIQTEHKVLNVFVDSKFKPKGDNGVYLACIQNGWTALRGEGKPQFWHNIRRGKQTMRVPKSYSELIQGDPESGTAHEGRRYCNLIHFATNVYGDRLQQLIQKKLWVEPQVGPGEMENEYRRQMSSEFKRAKKNEFTGHTEFVWVCPSGNNHLWDCSKMQVLAATLAEMLPDIDGSTPEPETTPQPKDPPPPEMMPESNRRPAGL